MENENVVEFLKGADTATATLSQGRYISKIKKLAEKYPDECEVFENKDGSILAHFPVKWIKISPPRQMSDEQKEAASDRFKKMWAEKNG